MVNAVKTISEKNHTGSKSNTVSLRVTLSHVAKEAGVAVSTASAILGKKKHCYASEKTRQIVEEAAEKLGYTPNRFARGLRGQSTKLLGMICSDLSRPAVMQNKVSSIEEEAMRDGMQVIFGMHRNDPQRERDYIQEFLACQVDGLLLFAVNPDNLEFLSDLAVKGMPIVVCETELKHSVYMPSVTANRQQAGYMQVKHVIEDAKRKKILFLMGSTGGLGRDKVSGYNKALKELGSDMSEHIVAERKIVEGDVFHTGFEMTQEVIDKGLEFDAIVATCDGMAFGAMSILSRIGNKIPEDVAVVGFDDEDFSSVLPVPLTTIRHPKGLAKTGYDMLRELIKGKGKTPPEKHPALLLETELIIRESTTKKKCWSSSGNRC